MPQNSAVKLRPGVLVRHLSGAMSMMINPFRNNVRMFLNIKLHLNASVNADHIRLCQVRAWCMDSSFVQSLRRGRSSLKRQPVHQAVLGFVKSGFQLVPRLREYQTPICDESRSARRRLSSSRLSLRSWESGLSADDLRR